MKTIKRPLQFFSIAILAVFFMNFAASTSFVGDFSTESTALSTHAYVSQSPMQEAAFPALLLGAVAGVVVVAAFVIGFVDGWNCGPITMIDSYGVDPSYHKTDFSKFDL